MSVLTLDGRLSFPDLYEATQYEGQGEFRYGATLLIEKGSASDKMIQAEIKRVGTEKWKAKADAILKSLESNSNKNCYVDGDSKTYDGYEGCMALSARRPASAGRPVVGNRQGHPVNEGDPGAPYAGCYVRARVEFWAQDNNFGKGMRCTLRSVQFLRDGDSFSGVARVNAESELEDLGIDEEDSLA